MSGRKSYSYLDPEGRIVWSDPNPSSSAIPPVKKHTRLETDEEVGVRLRGVVNGYDRFHMPKGHELDSELKRYNLEPRKHIEEEA
jgi:hypothetical protein